MRHALWVPGLVVCWLGACGGDDSGDGSGSARGRGTAACNEWQDATCDFAERCGTLPRQECDDSYKSITCADDSVATHCAELVRDVSCDGVTLEILIDCSIVNVADPAPAVAACNEFVDALCAAAERCGETIDCDAYRASLGCETAIGYAPSFEQCISEVESVECSASQSPAACEGAIKKFTEDLPGGVGDAGAGTGDADAGTGG